MENEAMKSAEETWILRRVLWSSNKEKPHDYYADKLELRCQDDTKFALRLDVGGTVTQIEIKDIWKYL